jgi:hypothetical protein
VDAHVWRVHSEIKNYQCEEFHDATSDKSNLAQHRKNVHRQIRDKHYPYRDCDYSSSRQYMLDIHVKSVMIGAQRNENTLVQHECIFKTESYLLLARVDKLEAVLSSLLLVLAAASAVPWAVWQEAG